MWRAVGVAMSARVGFDGERGGVGRWFGRKGGKANDSLTLSGHLVYGKRQNGVGILSAGKAIGKGQRLSRRSGADRAGPILRLR